jgi:hypothetical protein
MEPLTETEPIIITQPAQEPKSNEHAADVIGKLTKHSVIVEKGTTFLIIFSILAFYAAMYLIHMESVDRHFQSPVSNTAARR